MTKNKALRNTVNVQGRTLLDYSPMNNRYFDGLLHRLAGICAPEKWCFDSTNGLPVLKNLLTLNFMRIDEEDSLLPAQGKSPKLQQYYDGSIRRECFNTGLCTPDGIKLYAVSRPHPSPSYQDRMLLDDFIPADKLSRDYGVDTSKDDKADFLTDKLSVNTDLKIVPNYDHITGDNLSRWPLPFQAKSKDELKEILDDRIERTKRELKDNPQNAAMYYYRPNAYIEGRIQLLLPLKIEGEAVDMALALERKRGFLYAVTCLKREWAYSNARVLGRPQADWLDPSTM